LRVRPRERNARLQPRDHHPVVAAAIVPLLRSVSRAERRPNLVESAMVLRWRLGSGSEDADNCMGRLTEPDGLAGNLRVRPEPPAPECLADDGGFGGVWPVLVFAEHSAEHGACS